MSKPTDFQKRVIEAIKRELDYLATSNDIDSPSHGTSIDNDMFNHMDEWWPDQDLPIAGERFQDLCDIVTRVGNLWVAIASLEKTKR